MGSYLDRHAELYDLFYAEKAYAEAEVSPDEVDVCELHDCFSANELITYEALGFAAEGEAHKLVEAEATTFGGDVSPQPTNRGFFDKVKDALGV